jgi:hypothetical protein
MNRRIKLLLAACLFAASLTTAAAPTAEQRQQLNQAFPA